jgi:hypothetical protein
LPVQKTLKVGLVGSGICSMLSSEHFDASLISTRHHHRW